MNPKYQTVADALRAGIQAGKYQKTLPTEQALCAQFQVSRQTVRQALSLLEAEGLIDRRQGSGSHIRQQKESASPSRRSIAVVTTYICIAKIGFNVPASLSPWLGLGVFCLSAVLFYLWKFVKKSK